MKSDIKKISKTDRKIAQMGYGISVLFFLVVIISIFIILPKKPEYQIVIWIVAVISTVIGIWFFYRIQVGKESSRKNKVRRPLNALMEGELKTLKNILVYKEENKRKKEEAQKIWVNYRDEVGKYKEIVENKLPLEKILDLQEEHFYYLSAPATEYLKKIFEEETGHKFKLITSDNFKNDMDLFTKFYCFYYDYFCKVTTAMNRARDEREGKLPEHPSNPKKQQMKSLKKN
jgi:hypothetical protein